MFGHKKAVLEMPADSSASAGGGALGYAGFWRRVIAFLVDSVIVNIIVFVIAIPLIIVLEDWSEWIAYLVCTAVPLIYWPLMESSARQATFGKILMGLKVTDGDGSRLSFLKAFLRSFAKIVSSLTLGIGFLLAAFTARKQALHDMITNCLVVREGPSYLLRAVLAVVVGFIVVVGGGGYYVYKVFISPYVAGVKGSTEQSRKAMKEAPRVAQPSKPAATTAREQPAQAPAPSAPRAGMGAAEYDKILATPLSGIDKPSSARAGPAIVHIGTHFSDSLPLEVLVPPVTHLNHVRVSVTIDRVLDAKGANLYDRDAAFEQEFFRKVGLTRGITGSPHFFGTRKVYVAKGAAVKDVQKVEGVLHLVLPLDLKLVSAGAGDVGKELPVGPVKVTLKSFERDAVSLTVSGPAENFFGATAFDAQGAEVQVNSISRSGGQYTYGYRAPVTRVEMAATADLLKREYPFSVTRGVTALSATATAAPAKPAAPEKPVAVALVPAKPAADKPAAAPAKPAAVEVKPAPAKPTPAPAKKAEAAPKPVAQAAPSDGDKPRAKRRDAPRKPAAALPEMAMAPAEPAKTPRYNDVMTGVVNRDRAGVAEALDAGFWADRRDSNGVTSLMVAAMNGDTAMVQLLLKHGADPNLSGPGGSVLSYASRSGDGKLVELLRQAGAR